MNVQKLQDLVAKGSGVSARKFGSSYIVYRPRGVNKPTRSENKVIEFCAAFSAEANGPPHGPDYGQALWWGSFDARYTQAGDYLVGDRATYFIARQWSGLPIQCILTNRVVTIVRPLPAQQGNYSGFFASPGELVISDWPVSLLASGSHSVGIRPAETRLGSWDLLLPGLPVNLMVADVVSDDIGGSYVVGSAEQSSLGWRLLVRQLGA